MTLAEIITPLGIIGYLLMLVVVLTGMRVIKVKVKVHKILALVAIIAATLHVFIIIYLNYL